MAAGMISRASRSGGAALVRAAASRFAGVPSSSPASRRVAVVGSKAGNAALMLIDLQKDYISGGDLVAGQTSPLLEAFPELPGNVAHLLGRARQRGMPIVHVRERDSAAASAWLPWWDALHPPGGVGFGSDCPRRRRPELARQARYGPAQASPSPGRRKKAASRSSSSTRPFRRRRVWSVSGRDAGRRYDAFLSGDCSTRLRQHLAATGVRRLYVCGALTKACVMFTANSAFFSPAWMCAVRLVGRSA